jgi:hypothetical protein
MGTPWCIGGGQQLCSALAPDGVLLPTKASVAIVAFNNKSAFHHLSQEYNEM